MACKNVHGVCPLCLKAAQLCKSHYLGRVLHNLSRDGKDHPVVMTPKLVKATPSQMWAHLLCTDCERRFNDRGEKPVIALFNGAKNDFPLLNRMKVALPLKVEPTVEKVAKLRLLVYKPNDPVPTLRRTCEIRYRSNVAAANVGNSSPNPDSACY